jgi:hypothetical protein
VKRRLEEMPAETTGEAFGAPLAGFHRPVENAAALDL